MNYIELHLGDYLRDTAHLTPQEHGIYLLLLMRYYADEAPIADAQAHRYARAPRAEVEPILAEFFERDGEVWRHARVEAELAKYAEKREKAKVAAAASVRSRFGDERKANAVKRSERMAAARQKGKHTNAQWSALLVVCGHACVKCGASGHLDRDHIVPVYQGGSDHISNIQPLCARCNAAKGPENIDYRPSGWWESVQRLLNVRSTDVEPTSHQSPVEDQELSDASHPHPSADAPGARADLSAGFAEFWDAYPRKEAKATALKVWKARRIAERPDLLATILADVRNRAQVHRPWLEGFIPHAPTYLRNERWTDAIDRSGPRGKATGPPPRESLQARVARKNGLAHLFGDDPGRTGGSDERAATGRLVGGDDGDLPAPLDSGGG